jgi:hypothetical protein
VSPALVTLSSPSRAPSLVLRTLHVRTVGWRNCEQPPNDIIQTGSVRAVHGRSDRRGNRSGNFRADRVHPLPIGRRQRRGLAPQPHEFGTADFLESTVKRTGYGTHAGCKGKANARRQFADLWPENSRIPEIPGGSVPDIRQLLTGIECRGFTAQRLSGPRRRNRRNVSPRSTCCAR